ncbi:hypothetical protein ODI_R3451 [Orrella dioscoreae]|uniref:Uncharacterized protein n=1 Tax=Orrella dioscoreae TaxID=1851544 RepID=A0A1C3JY10_9BURK|nr:hypothetical protein ODI_02204 [Orrella dioscoreae]SOE51452.1 hypothetical protein ODI_R3451 [Orrella dioscoreae]
MSLARQCGEKTLWGTFRQSDGRVVDGVARAQYLGRVGDSTRVASAYPIGKAHDMATRLGRTSRLGVAARLGATRLRTTRRDRTMQLDHQLPVIVRIDELERQVGKIARRMAKTRAIESLVGTQHNLAVTGPIRTRRRFKKEIGTGYIGSARHIQPVERGGRSAHTECVVGTHIQVAIHRGARRAAAVYAQPVATAAIAHVADGAGMRHQGQRIARACDHDGILVIAESVAARFHPAILHDFRIVAIELHSPAPSAADNACPSIAAIDLPPIDEALLRAGHEQPGPAIATVTGKSDGCVVALPHSTATATCAPPERARIHEAGQPVNPPHGGAPLASLDAPGIRQTGLVLNNAATASTTATYKYGGIGRRAAFAARASKYQSIAAGAPPGSALIATASQDHGSTAATAAATFVTRSDRRVRSKPIKQTCPPITVLQASRGPRLSPTTVPSGRAPAGTGLAGVTSTSESCGQ